MKTWIKGGLVYDGSGCQPEYMDILIEDSRISRIEKTGERIDGKGRGQNDWNQNGRSRNGWNGNAGDQVIVINASGKVVTPGFIDSHRHCDAEALQNIKFGQAELAQGITTALAGNCGMSLYPSDDSTRRGMYGFMEPCLGKILEEIGPCDMASYRKLLEERNLSLNIGSLTGTGAVRNAVKGFQKTPFSEAEMDRACSLIREAMDQGAFGLSSGIMYIPECYNTPGEFKRLLQAAGTYDRIWSCHIRGEGDSLVQATEEAVNLSKESGMPLNISHFKSVGSRNWGREICRAIDVIEASKADVTVDFYPYTGGATTLLTLLPPSMIGETIAGTLLALKIPAGQDRLRKALKESEPGWDNMVRDIGWERIIVSSVNQPENEKYVGRSISENARRYGFKDEAGFLAELLWEEDGKAGGILMSMEQKDVDRVAALPYSMVISDALYGSPKHPHPRLYGAFPKMIREYVMERKILTMEEAIHKMSGKTAKRFGIQERGYLREGYYADINIFDPHTLKDTAVYTKPASPAEGMEYVFVNGKIAWWNGEVKEPAGRVLLKER